MSSELYYECFQVNELSTIVDQLNKKCSSLAESKVRLQETAQDATALSPLTFKENSLSTKLSNGVGVTNDPSVSIVNNDVTSYTESEIVEIMESKDHVTVEDGENGLSVSDSIGTVGEVKQITFNSVRKPVDMASKLENCGLYCFLLKWRKLLPLLQKSK